MDEPSITLTVRPVDAATSIVGIRGELSVYAESALMDAFARASGPDTRTIILDFTGLDYMNSGGIGLLVTLLIRTQRQGQRMLAYGLSDHYQRIFAMTRLNETINVFETEREALAAASGG